MRARRLFLLLVAYLAFDFADPILPGAFSFEVKDSEVEEALHVQRHRHGKEVAATRPAPPQRHLEPSDDTRLRARLMPTTGQAPRDEWQSHQAVRFYLTASALASPIEDH